jgi:hypothetical protein
MLRFETIFYFELFFDSFPIYHQYQYKNYIIFKWINNS